MQILDGKALSLEIKEELKRKVQDRIDRGTKRPRLDIVMVGDDYATSMYVSIKRSMGEDIGVDVVVHKFDSTIETKELVGKINEVEGETNGILVQLPLPKHIDTRKVLNSVPLHLDVDGLNSKNLEMLRRNESEAIPAATALGIVTLLKKYNIGLKGKKVCMIGSGVETGQPISAILSNEGCIVSICDINTKDIQDISKESDIVISATGTPEMITKEWLKKDSVVVDVGISRKEGKLVGDVKYDDVIDQVSYITPVPGGVGPMTVVCLFRNLID